MLDHYQVRALALDEHVEDWLAPEDAACDDEGVLAQRHGLDVRVFQAVREEEEAFHFHGNDGAQRWREANPELAALLEALP